MKMLYVVNTKQDADAYRVYSKVHMDGKATRSAKITALAAGYDFAAAAQLVLGALLFVFGLWRLWQAAAAGDPLRGP